MCRTGGRRCPGCNGETARAKHNARRRKNRAIKAAVLEYMRSEGASESVIAAIRDQPPAVAKAWAREHQLNKDKLGVSLSHSYGDKDPSPERVDPGQVFALPPAEPRGPGAAAGLGGEPARGAGPRRAVGGAGGGAVGDLSRFADGPPESVNTPMREAARRLLQMLGKQDAVGPKTAGVRKRRAGGEDDGWMTPGLMGQVSTAMSNQGRNPVERLLLESEAEGVEYPHGAGVNETLRVDLGNGTYAYAKAFEGLDNRTARGYGHDSAQQPIHEVAAWRVAERMGKPWSTMVAPCVLRSVNGKVGSLSLERPGDPGHIGDSADRRAGAFFDALIGNQDRHRGNYLVDNRRRMTLIDHGFAFKRPGDYQNASDFQRSHCNQRLTDRERAILAEFLGDDTSFGLKGLIEEDRLDAMRRRARDMVADDSILPAWDQP